MGEVVPFEVKRLCFVCGELSQCDPRVEISFCQNCRDEPWLKHLLNHAAVGEMVLGSPDGTTFQKTASAAGTVWHVAHQDTAIANPDLEIALLDLFEVM